MKEQTNTLHAQNSGAQISAPAQKTDNDYGCEYDMEQLLPVVGKLAEKYTSRENTSVSYETAEKLMEAVLYCIREGKAARCCPLPAQQAYETGAAAVREKAAEALRLYNEIIPDFLSYGSRCLHDTFVRGMPEFFKWYDVRFAPQDTILTLDYPVLRSLSAYSGIDRIYEYIRCIRLEQAFLALFPEDQVIRILTEDNADYRDMAENLCETVLTCLAKNLLAKQLLIRRDCRDETGRQSSLCSLQDALACISLQDLRLLLRERITAFLQGRCDEKKGGANAAYEKSFGNGRIGEIACLTDYFSETIDNIAVRLQTAAKHHALKSPRSPFCAETTAAGYPPRPPEREMPEETA